MVPDLANQQIPEPYKRPQQISKEVRDIARLFGLCFQKLKRPDENTSNHYVMYRAMYESIDTRIPKEKRIFGGVVCDLENNMAYAFGEFKDQDKIQTLRNSIPNLDDSFLGGEYMEFIELSMDELTEYLAGVFTEHNNNGRKKAVEFTPYIQSLN